MSDKPMPEASPEPDWDTRQRIAAVEDVALGPEPTGTKRLLRQLDDLRAGNQQRLADLAKLGAAPNPIHVIATRLECLIAGLPDDNRLAFDMAYEQQMAGLLDQAKTEATRARLAVPGPGPISGMRR